MRKNNSLCSLGLASLGIFVSVGLPAFACAAEQELVRVAEGGRGFELAESKQAFVPWGFNYDHDEQGRLIEDYWETEWAKVEQDFHEMKELGANVVRVHLQLGKFMSDAQTPNKQRLRNWVGWSRSRRNRGCISM